MKTKRTTKVTEALTALNKNDIYSLMLFTLYKLHDDPEYLTLTELAYVLDGDNLSKFLTYFGGLTLKVPQLREMRLVVQGLLLFQYINLEGLSMEDGLKTLSNSNNEFSNDEIKTIYKKILEVTQDYDFNRE